MGEWGLSGGQRITTVGVVAASTGGTVITAAGSANTKGAYTELIATTPHAAEAIVVFARRASTAGDALIDLAIGAAASEQIIVPNLGKSQNSDYSAHALYLPIRIPAGVRLAARIQHASASATVQLQVMLLGQSWTGAVPFSRVTDYGANTADSGGTGIDPGGVANTKGAYSQLTAATTNRCSGLLVFFGNQGSIARTAGSHWNADIAIGAGGSEQIIIPDLPISAEAVGDILVCTQVFVPVLLPAGVRLAARAACTVTSSPGRLIDVICYGVD